jgi:hypothetical protein
MRIVYFLHTHTRPHQVARLVERLRRGADALVLVHHDAGAPALRLPARDDVHVLADPVAVRWGHVSQVRATLRGLDWLLAERIDFDWLLTLSGQDHPARPLAAIERELAGADCDAFVQHVRVFRTARRNRSWWQQICRRRYFARPVRVLGRTLWLPRRHPYRHGLRCFAGSSWLNLSRRAVVRIGEERALRDALLRYLADAPSPDESFFQTLLRAAPGLRIESRSRRFLRWQRGASHPELLTRDDLPALLASDAFFARKFDEERHPGVLDALDAALERSAARAAG